MENNVEGYEAGVMGEELNFEWADVLRKEEMERWRGERSGERKETEREKSFED